MSTIFQPALQCNLHGKNIEHIILLQEKNQDQRLLCNRCDLNERTNIFYIVKTFEFADECFKNENRIEQEIYKKEQEFLHLKNHILQLIKNVEDCIISFKQQFNKEPKIAKNVVSLCLEKKNLCTEPEILDMANNLEKLLSKQNKLETNRYKQLDLGLEEVEKKIQELKKFNNLNNIENIENSKNPENLENSKKLENQSLLQQQSLISDFKQVDFVDFTTKNQLVTWNNIYDLSFNRTNFLLAVGGSLNQDKNSYIQILQLQDRNYQFLCNVNGPQDDVKSLCFSHKDDSLFSGQKDSIIYYTQQSFDKWVIAQVITRFEVPVACLQIQEKTNTLAAGSDFLYLYAQNPQTKEIIKQQKLEQNKKPISHINFPNSANSQNKQQLVIASKDPAIYIYEFVNGRNEYQLMKKIDDLTQQVQVLSFYNDSDIYALLQDNSSIYFSYSYSNFDYEKIISKIDEGTIQTASFNKMTSNLIIKPLNKNEVIIINISNNVLKKHDQRIQFKADRIFMSKNGQKLGLFGEQTLKIYSDEQDRY